MTWDNDPYYEEEPQPCVCGDTGWLEFLDGLVIPCTECSGERDEYDLELEDDDGYGLALSKA